MEDAHSLYNSCVKSVRTYVIQVLGCVLYEGSEQQCYVKLPLNLVTTTKQKGVSNEQTGTSMD